MGNKVLFERFRRWNTCSLCEQNYHGVVACALGWACWKTYCSRPETDWLRHKTMTVLGNGLVEAKRYAEALEVYQASLQDGEHMGPSLHDPYIDKCNIAVCYHRLGLPQEALSMQREVYAAGLTLNLDPADKAIDASNLAAYLVAAREFEEAKSLLRKTIPMTLQDLGSNHSTTLDIRGCYARALSEDDSASRDDLVEAVAILEEVSQTARRIYGTGPAGLVVEENEARLVRARSKLVSFDALAEGVRDLSVS